MYHLYILECGDGTLYTGITTDLDRRFKEHSSGKGAGYTRAHKPSKFVYTEKFRGRGAALKRESEVKKLSRKEKLDLIGRFV